jgi:DNA-binding NarL/FixJ family response regulator
MSTIRILLADDHGIRALLQSLPEIEVIGEADDGREALQLISELRPDVVLMDIAMPGFNGLEATARIAHEFPNVRVIILSMHASEEYVLQALRAGASGYLLKGARLPELELAVLSVARGETYLSPAASKHLITGFVQRSSEAGDHTEQTTRPAERLTPRQREILQLIAKGATTKEISQQLSISVKTVEMHRTQLMERLGIHDIAGLVRYAIRHGMITPEG